MKEKTKILTAIEIVGVAILIIAATQFVASGRAEGIIWSKQPQYIEEGVGWISDTTYISQNFTLRADSKIEDALVVPHLLTLQSTQGLARLKIFTVEKSGLIEVYVGGVSLGKSYLDPDVAQGLRFASCCTVSFVDLTRETSIIVESHGYEGEFQYIISIPSLGGQPIPTMPGIPVWLFLASAGAVVGFSFILITFFGRRRPKDEYFRHDLLQIKPLKRLVKKRCVQFIFQAPIAALFLFTIYAGIFGTQLAGRNLSTILTWNWWWVILIFAILFLGKIYCFMCPWEAIASWIQHGTFWRKIDIAHYLGLNRSWPRFLRNIYLATGLFMLLTWLELGFGVASKPIYTAYLGIAILAMTVIGFLIFERASFCRYACLIGRVSGLYALFSPVEVRSKNKEVCKNCRTKDCFKGNERGYGCPTFLNLTTLDSNTYCILCSECVKTCPHDNVSFNIRSFGADLTKSMQTHKDEAYLSVIMLYIVSFHGLTMIPPWSELLDAITGLTGVGYYGAFTIGMALPLLLLLYLYFVVVRGTRLFSGRREAFLAPMFVNYAYSLLPIAFFYHIAHNVAHFFTEAGQIIPVLSDPLGLGWDIFGTAYTVSKPLLPMDVIWYIQIILIIIGHIIAIYIAHITSFRIFENKTQAIRSQIPMTAFMVVYSMFSLWLVAQPMILRTPM